MLRLLGVATPEPALVIPENPPCEPAIVEAPEKLPAGRPPPPIPAPAGSPPPPIPAPMLASRPIPPTILCAIARPRLPPPPPSIVTLESLGCGAIDDTIAAVWQTQF